MATRIDPASPTASPSSHSDEKSPPNYDVSEPLPAGTQVGIGSRGGMEREEDGSTQRSPARTGISKVDNASTLEGCHDHDLCEDFGRCLSHVGE